MGPQPFGCGRAAHGGGGSCGPTASMGPQPFGCGRECISARRGIEIHGFNGAATFRLRKGPGPRMAARATTSFNGAATFRLRKGGAIEVRSGGHLASMGPQPFGCGRRVEVALKPKKNPLQWGRNLSVAEGTTRTAIEWADSTLLQWGRNLSVAEGSTGPIGIGAGGSFNGAATFRLRKATMGTSQESCGKWLQWGRNLSVAEGGLRPIERTDHPTASMGPQPFGCGRRATVRQDRTLMLASMGPQPFGCGRRNIGGGWPDQPQASMGPQPFGCGRHGL